jgi:hypothetical protein
VVGVVNLAAVMQEVADAVNEITGLRTSGWPVGSLVAPGAIVTYPDSIDYDETYGRGLDKITNLPLWVVIGQVKDKSARDRAGEYAAGKGARSIKQRLEGRGWSSLDTLTVTKCRFDTVTEAGVDYLAALFSIDIFGDAS